MADCEREAMNYYERHLGDYARDAGHLTMLEHGAYTLLLDRYYTTEHGIPADQAHRVCRARTRDEKAAVDSVLSEFFTLQDGVWVNGRAERELADYRAREPEREAKKANNRERQERSRERRRAMFEELRSRGVVPSYDASMTELQVLLSRINDAQRNSPVTRDCTATQTPDTRHQTPSSEEGEYSPTTRAGAHEPDVSGFTPTKAGTVCKALRQAGIADTNPGHPRLLALLEAGATEAEFTGFVPAAIDGGKGFAWVLGAVEGERKRAALTAPQLHRGAMPAPMRAPTAAEQRVLDACPELAAPHLKRFARQQPAPFIDMEGASDGTAKLLG